MENTGDILCFFLRKRYRPKLCEPGKFINFVSTWDIFPHLGTKQKQSIVKMLTKFDWRMGEYSGQFWKLTQAVQTLNFLGSLFGALHSRRRLKNLNVVLYTELAFKYVLLCERVLFHFRKLFPCMVDPFCTKPCINNTNVAQLSINTPGIAANMISSRYEIWITMLQKPLCGYVRCQLQAGRPRARVSKGNIQ